MQNHLSLHHHNINNEIQTSAATTTVLTATPAQAHQQQAPSFDYSQFLATLDLLQQQHCHPTASAAAVATTESVTSALTDEALFTLDDFFLSSSHNEDDDDAERVSHLNDESASSGHLSNSDSSSCSYSIIDEELEEMMMSSQSSSSQEEQEEEQVANVSSATRLPQVHHQHQHHHQVSDVINGLQVKVSQPNKENKQQQQKKSVVVAVEKKNEESDGEKVKMDNGWRVMKQDSRIMSHPDDGTRIVLSSRKFSSSERIDAELYSCVTYEMRHEAFGPFVTQTSPSTTTATTPRVLLVRVEVIDPVTNQVVLKNNKTILNGCTEGAISKLNHSDVWRHDMKIKFNSCSYHFSKTSFAFRVSYFLENGQEPFLVKQSSDFMIYARVKKQEKKSRTSDASAAAAVASVVVVDNGSNNNNNSHGQQQNKRKREQQEQEEQSLSKKQCLMMVATTTALENHGDEQQQLSLSVQSFSDRFQALMRDVSQMSSNDQKIALHMIHQQLQRSASS